MLLWNTDNWLEMLRFLTNFHDASFVRVLCEFVRVCAKRSEFARRKHFYNSKLVLSFIQVCIWLLKLDFFKVISMWFYIEKNWHFAASFDIKILKISINQFIEFYFHQIMVFDSKIIVKIALKKTTSKYVHVRTISEMLTVNKKNEQ